MVIKGEVGIRSGKQFCRQFFCLSQSDITPAADKFAGTLKKANVSTRLSGKKMCLFASLTAHDAL